VITVLSAYVMVNFAIEENAKAGLAFGKVTRQFMRTPVQLLYGFLLASGIQILSLAIPCITIVGIFLVPSAYFVGMITSSIVLARHWSVCERIEGGAAPK